MLIPYRARLNRWQNILYYVVNADTVAQRKVLLGQRIRDMVIVKSGLQENEIIVLDGVQKLRDGSKVKLQQSASSGADSLDQHPKQIHQKENHRNLKTA